MAKANTAVLDSTVERDTRLVPVVVTTDNGMVGVNDIGDKALVNILNRDRSEFAYLELSPYEAAQLSAALMEWGHAATGAVL